MLDQQSPMPMPVQSGLEGFLAERGIGYSSRLVLDLASNERVQLGQRGMFAVIAPYPLWPVSMPASDHMVTRGLNSLTFGWAAPLEVTDTVGVTPLWQTTEAGAVRTASQPIYPDQEWSVPDEELAHRTIAVAVDRAAAAESDGPAPGRMIVVGDVTFAEGQFVQSNPANLAFIANSIDWLAQDEALIRIRSKVRTPPALVFESDLGRNLLKWGNLLGVPLLLALVGTTRVTGRRRRAEAKWKEVVS
jgi:ABC-type uncharacterized transport system involved in gliding motility auxiliary subunit